MTCIYFLPQIQTNLGNWIDADKPQDTFEKAEEILIGFVFNSRITNSRIQQVSCSEKTYQRKPCCGK